MWYCLIITSLLTPVAMKLWLPWSSAKLRNSYQFSQMFSFMLSWASSPNVCTSFAFSLIYSAFIACFLFVSLEKLHFSHISSLCSMLCFSVSNACYQARLFFMQFQVYYCVHKGLFKHLYTVKLMFLICTLLPRHSAELLSRVDHPQSHSFFKVPDSPQILLFDSSLSKPFFIVFYFLWVWLCLHFFFENYFALEFCQAVI